MIRDSWQIKTNAQTVVGFDHEHHDWDPAYRYLDSNSLMSTGMGVRHVVGHQTVAKVSTYNPPTVCRVIEKFRELSGEPLPVFIEGYDNWGFGIDGPILYHYRAAFYDSPQGRLTEKLLQAIKEA